MCECVLYTTNKLLEETNSSSRIQTRTDGLAANWTHEAANDKNSSRIN